jgi:hypothetical protein
VASDDLAGWYRVGGHRFQFYATDAEVAEWLTTTLPSKFAPYSIVGREWEGDRWKSFEYPLAAIGECFTHHRTSNLWLRSEVLSPGLTGDEKRLSFSGLILLQLGRERDSRLEEISIAVVDRIRHETTGRERRHANYRRLFERLRRSMRKRLVIDTIRTLPDGRVSEDWPMTAHAADACVRGEVAFAAEPVAEADH